MTKKAFQISAVFLLLSMLFIGCNNRPDNDMDEEPEVVDTLTVLDRLMEKGTLFAVTDCDLLNYSMVNGKMAGFQYDLLNDLCKSLNLKLDLQVVDNVDSCLRLLDSCKIDLLATEVGLNKEMKRSYLLTDPIITKKCVLVQRLPKKWHDMSTYNEIENQLLRSPLELAGKTIHVPAGNHAVRILEHLSEEIGDTIYIVQCDTLNSLKLIQMVESGQIDYTVADEHIAQMAVTNSKGLDNRLAVSIDQPIGWALPNQGDSSVLLAVNTWIDNYEQKNIGRTLAKYIKKRSLPSRYEPSGNRISDFDPAIKKVAKKIGWDWRLLASLIYQESRFHTDLESDKGAFGLMQLMPVVMEKYEIDYDSSPEEQLEAGGKLIHYLDQCLDDKVIDSVERIKFVLAAYNAGLGHVYDARRLAEKYGKDPNVWTDNVDFFILNKSKPQYYNDTCCKAGRLRGTETYRFVEEVTERYEQYRALVNE